MFQSVLQTLERDMEDFLKWRKSWLTGIETLDAQHAELATCLNNIARICFCKDDPGSKTGSWKTDQLENLTAQLYDKSKQHFQYEEQLMLEAGYPGYSAHVNEHSMLLAELKLVIRTVIKKGDGNIDPEILEALKSWFIIHIAHSDKLFAQFVSRQRVCEPVSGEA